MAGKAYDPLMNPVGAERYLREQYGLTRGRQPADPSRPRHCPDCGIEVHAGAEVTVKAFNKGEYRCGPCRAEKRRLVRKEKARKMAYGELTNERSTPLKYSARDIEARLREMGELPFDDEVPKEYRNDN